jgi:hypothetical protein
MVSYISDPTGRFPQRPYWLERELDRECEIIVERFLRRHRGKIEYPIRTEDLKTLVEDEAQDLDQYADLSAHGSDVEGITVFEHGRRPSVRLASCLAEDDWRENRLRTTLTHEYGHVHFHGPLFAAHPHAGDLFEPAPLRPEVTSCKRDKMIDPPKVDWMEWQAGHISGAVLMPASAVRRTLAHFHERLGSSGPVRLESVAGQGIIQAVVAGFQVSKDAARVRLTRLRYLGTPMTSGSLFTAR